MSLRELFGGNPPSFKLPSSLGAVGYTLQVEPASRTLGWAAPVAPGTGVAVANQADMRLVTCSATNDILEGETNLTFDPATQTLAVPNLSGLSTINGSAYPPPASQVSVSNQADNRLITATAVTDALAAETDLTYDGVTQTLAVQNLSGVSNINGVAYPPPSISVSNQADNRVVTATAVTDALNAETDLTWDGTALNVGSLRVRYTAGAVQTVSIAANGGALGGNNAVIIGHNAFSGNSSVSIGNNTLRSNTSGGFNVAVGSATGTAVTGGNGLCLLGSNNSGQMSTGTNNTCVGVSAGVGITTQSNNTICGYFSDVRDGANISYANCSVLGANIRNVITGNNQVQLGDSATTTYVYGTVQTRSDARDKADVKDTALGLDFIEALRPVDFRWDYREDYRESTINPETQEEVVVNREKDGSKKRGRFHHGFIAQEVKATCDRLGIDFGGYQDHTVSGGAERQSLGYEELIGPLVRAVQQLSARVRAVEAR